MTDVVLALGFDLFFKPKLNAAAQAVGVELRYALPGEAAAKSAGAMRIIADVSAPGVEEALRAVHAALPSLPILACYPHVEEHRAQAVREMGGRAITRGLFAQRLEKALRGEL